MIDYGSRTWKGFSQPGKLTLVDSSSSKPGVANCNAFFASAVESLRILIQRVLQCLSMPTIFIHSTLRSRPFWMYGQRFNWAQENNSWKFPVSRVCFVWTELWCSNRRARITTKVPRFKLRLWRCPAGRGRGHALLQTQTSSAFRIFAFLFLFFFCPHAFSSYASSWSCVFCLFLLMLPPSSFILFPHFFCFPLSSFLFSYAIPLSFPLMLFLLMFPLALILDWVPPLAASSILFHPPFLSSAFLFLLCFRCVILDRVPVVLAVSS